MITTEGARDPGLHSLWAASGRRPQFCRQYIDLLELLDALAEPLLALAMRATLLFARRVDSSTRLAGPGDDWNAGAGLDLSAALYAARAGRCGL